MLVVLSTLGGSLFLQSINDNNLVKRHVDSTRAFWAAEAGVAEGIRKLRDCDIDGECTVEGNITYENSSYQYNVTISQLDGTNYQIDSTVLGTDVTKIISIGVKLNETD